MITHAEYLKHAQFVREVAIRNGDLWTAMTLMDGSAEAEAIRKSQKIVNAYGWQRRTISFAEFQTNVRLVQFTKLLSDMVTCGLLCGFWIISQRLPLYVDHYRFLGITAYKTIC